MIQEALKLALEFIERVNKDGWILADFEPEMYATITAIKEALAQEQCKYPDCKCPTENPCLKGLAQPEQEHPAPCARHCEATAFQITIKNLEAQLAQRTWQGLTNEEKLELWEISRAALPRYATYANLIEAKLKQKNGYAEENT